MDRKLILNLISIIAAISGCTLEEPIDIGDKCPPTKFVMDVCETDDCNDTNLGCICEVTKSGNCEPLLDNNNNLIYPEKDNNGNYIYNSTVLYKYSIYKTILNNNKTPKISYIQGRCTSEEDCSEVGYGYFIKHSVCPEKESLCALMDEQFYCKLPVMQCTADNVLSCKLSINNWVSGRCENNLCIVEKCEKGYKPSTDSKTCVSDCSIGQHYDNMEQKCVDDDIDSCGSTNYACSKNVANWIDGKCEEGVCKVLECSSGFTPSTDNLFCVSNCKKGEHYDNSAQKCVQDDIDNCGSTGYICSVNVSEWVNGICDLGVCKVSECSDGFKPHTNALSCVSNCATGKHYDNMEQKCVDDDTSNCGSTGYNCALNVDQWVNGTCDAGVCKVSECSKGYVVAHSELSCVSSCDVGMHYDNAAQECVNDDLNNCGATDKRCSDIVPQWVDGRCESGTCKVTECSEGFVASYNELSCVSNCETGKHYDNSAQKCVNDDIFNCGNTGYVCSEKVGQWTDGSCIAGVCMVSVCETGYKVKDNKCVSDCQIGQHYDSEVASCVFDDIDNCGRTGYNCKNEIKNSSQVKCESGKCVVTECSNGYSVSNNACASSCTNDEYYDSDTAQCEDNSITNCGMKGFACAEKVDQWLDGACTKGVCTISACKTDYKVVDNVCKPDCGKDQHYDTLQAKCMSNDLNNCGAAGYKCSEKVAQWADGSCVEGVCTLTKCESGYKIVDNTCKSDCQIGEHYDNDLSKCVVDDINNCGATGHTCLDEIKNSDIVSCESGVCKVIKCNSGYSINNNVCTSSCTSSQYYDSTTGNCANSSEQNCGMKGYACNEKVDQWATGTCNNNICTLKSCQSGYKVVDNTCKPDCGSDQHYNTSTSQCENNDLNNCGAVGYKCSDKVAQWAEGACVVGVCTLSKCESGYKIVDNTCKSDCKIGEHYDSDQAKCVADDINNCGSTGHACKDEIKNSKNVNCTTGKCIVTECSTGYKVLNNVCTSDCTSSQYYDSTLGACSNSSTNNCGQKDYKCAEHVSNWNSGNCINNVCSVTTCNEGYTVINNECKADCGTTKYYDSSTGTCVASDINNCGMNGYKCASQVSNWLSGTCSANVCLVTSCRSGYKPSTDGKQCVSNCSVGQHYDSSQAKCVSDDVNNCGASGHRCIDEIKNSKTVSCNSGRCYVSACNSGYTVNNNTCVSSCTSSQYYDVTCKTSTIDNCGQKGYRCSDHISNWKSGSCNNNVCIVNTCQDGYTIVNNECKADCGTTKYYDSTTGACVASDISNCGMKGYKCASQVANWKSGNCSSNICIVTSCTTGYKPSSDGKSCVSDCSANQHYDSSLAKCVADDINNCGATGHSCKDEIKNSKTVSCNSGRCYVSACNSGYTVNNNTCVSSCTNSQYYDVTCKTSTTDNCGQKGYKCSEHISNWKSGSCTNNACVVSACQNGYAVVNNECKASCGSNQYYDNVTASCKTSDINNCGMSGYSCTSTAGWNDGYCTNNQCIATSCANDYHVASGKCIADTNTCCGSGCDDCTESSQMCTAGSCHTNCQGGTTLCKGSCINTAANHVASCTSTSLVCAKGYSDCNNNVGDGCETYINGSDNLNCGKCKFACAQGYYCSSGKCTSTCSASQKLCNGVCLTTSMLSTVFHVAINNVSCKCVTNYINANGDWADGCEKYNSGSTVTNCNGTDCTALLGWKTGTCTNGHCNASSCLSKYTLDTSSGYGVCKLQPIILDGCSSLYPFLCSDGNYCCTKSIYCSTASTNSNCRLALKPYEP